MSDCVANENQDFPVEVDEEKILKTAVRRAGEIKSRVLASATVQWHLSRYRGDDCADSMPVEDDLLELRHACGIMGIRVDELCHLILHDNLPYTVVRGDLLFSYFELMDHLESRDRRRLRYLHYEHDELHPYCERCKSAR